MKTVRMICGLFLVVICVFGWVGAVMDATSNQTDYVQHIAQAEENAARGLYQRAANCYRNALNIKETQEARRALVDVTRKGYEEDTMSREDYIDVLKETCSVQPKNTAYWEELLAQLYAGEDYSEAHSVLKNLASAKIEKTPRMEELADKVNYAYTVNGRMYSAFYPTTSGYTTVRRGDKWGMLSPDGEDVYECEYTYMSTYGEDKVVLFCTTSKNQIVDEDGIVQAALPQGNVIARGCGSGLMPIWKDNTWRYFDVEKGVYKEGSYQDASSFQNGRAVVKNLGIWSFLDLDGQTTTTDFQEVKLYANGEYCYDNRMVAKQDSYGIFTAQGERVEEFSATDMDVYMGGWIAFQNADGQWGFVDRDGAVMIEPQYQNARSFSAGLAAVYDGAAWGFINEAGRWVISAQFADAGYFTAKGVCLVGQGGEYHAIVRRFL